MRDYYPLREGLRLEYRCRRAEGDSGWRFEVVSAAAEAGGAIRALCRRAPLAGGAPRDFTVTKKADGVYIGGVLELPLPARPGRRWDLHPNSYRMDRLDAVKTVPAGTFRDCLRVVYAIAGGDAGWG
ncbi:MAG: hypothetical protein PHF00_08550, partial [Elusimicrobia bacterium]|nr:hypothetical protein [Elusimicrobiota bacterium]